LPSRALSCPACVLFPPLVFFACSPLLAAYAILLCSLAARYVVRVFGRRARLLPSCVSRTPALKCFPAPLAMEYDMFPKPPSRHRSRRQWRPRRGCACYALSARVLGSPVGLEPALAAGCWHVTALLYPDCNFLRRRRRPCLSLPPVLRPCRSRACLVSVYSVRAVHDRGNRLGTGCVTTAAVRLGYAAANVRYLWMLQ
jgi:hypothetical protein